MRSDPKLEPESVVKTPDPDLAKMIQIHQIRIPKTGGKKTKK
jgi:hypothetical protein